MHLLEISKIESLSDAVFAIAMTIMVLDLVPKNIMGLNSAQLILQHSAMNLVIFIASFLILATLWVSISFHSVIIETINRPYLWARIFMLMTICIIPFSSSVIAAAPISFWSILFFASNLLCTNIAMLCAILFAYKYSLNSKLYTKEIHNVLLKRLLVGPMFYLSAIIISIMSPRIAFFVLLGPTIFYMFPGGLDKFKLKSS